MAYAYPSGTNTFVPSWEATGQTIAFIRDPKSFKINDYVAFRPATLAVGLYLEYDFDHPARSLSLDQMAWADGDERPTGVNNLGGFEFKEYRTIRRSQQFTLGNQTIAQTSWPIVAANAATIMQQAMTALTRQTLAVLDTVGNWTGFTSTVEALIGTGAGTQYWDNGNVTPGDANYLNIKKTFDEVSRLIFLNTNGCVKRSDLCCVVSPTAARKMAETAEIVDMLKQSPFAYQQVTGQIPNINLMYGLPEYLYGIKMVVEDTVIVTSLKGATVARSYVKSDDQAFFVTKQNAMPGDNVGEMPMKNFSTYQVFYYADSNLGEIASSGDATSGLLSVEMLPDIRNKRTEGFVTWQTAEKMVALPSGYLVTDILA